MSQATDENKLIHFDFAELASVGFALFDVRNWYNGFLRVIKAGERVISQCFSTWNLFTDTMYVTNEDPTNSCCPLCKERPLGAPLEKTSKKRSAVTTRSIPRIINKKINNNSGAWVFVPDIKGLTTGSLHSGRKTQEVGVVQIFMLQ
ncbi:hypothetical protein NPIL_285001 [Nephila pilipes]|uniref:Uncharacterized protein n=1 Tax=Nephila pilipes TaxID=299642 RepID=A0A8X6TQC1_NEPPI|nr:hypothetical protein NPIL_285001 [Nephila pilipes]